MGTGAQLAACLALGADGVNMGTRFMATKEAPIHDGIKEALVRADERSTTLVMKSVGNTERVFKNDVAKEVQAIERRKGGRLCRDSTPRERRKNYRKSFQESGDPKSSVWSAGVVMGPSTMSPAVRNSWRGWSGRRRRSSAEGYPASSSQKQTLKHTGETRQATTPIRIV